MRHRFWIIGLAALVLASCSGGGGAGPSPQPAPRPTEVEAGRLLSQATFGATDASIDAVRSGSVEDWIRNQINTPSPSLTHQAALDAQLAEMRKTDPKAELRPDQFLDGWWRNAVTSPDQLRQRVAFAYSQIFVISLASDVVDARGAGSYYDMLTTNAFGNYRDILQAVTLHPMMGVYLTYLGNIKEDPGGARAPDQNYAREIMQLMTIGLFELNPDGTQKLDLSGRPVPAYTSADIAGLAKVFTGWSWYSPQPGSTTFFGGNRDPDASVRPMIFYPGYHSTSQKTFLGVTIPASATADGPGDLKIALDTLFNHPNTGPFVSRQMIQRLVTSNPSPAYVKRVAVVFANNGSGVRGDMGAVITAILTDPEARTASAATDPAYGKLREPVIRVSHLLRAFSGSSVSGDWRLRSTTGVRSLGQSPLFAPTVFNFWRPGYVPPATSALGSRNLVGPEFQVVNEIVTAGYFNTVTQLVNSGLGVGNDVRVSFAAEEALSDKPDQLAERLNRLLLSGQMSSVLRKRIVDAVNSIPVPATDEAQAREARSNRARIAVLLVATSPEYLAQR